MLHLAKEGGGGEGGGGGITEQEGHGLRGQRSGRFGFKREQQRQLQQPGEDA
jgi:hypothetical protein